MSRDLCTYRRRPGYTGGMPVRVAAGGLSELLKTRVPSRRARIAERHMNVTPMAVRQHLLRVSGGPGWWPGRRAERPVGRPRRLWRLGAEKPPSPSPTATATSPSACWNPCAASSGSRTPADDAAEGRADSGGLAAADAAGGRPLPDRVAALARIRKDEGYMAEWARRTDGASCWSKTTADPLRGPGPAPNCAPPSSRSSARFSDAGPASSGRSISSRTVRRCVYRIAPPAGRFGV